MDISIQTLLKEHKPSIISSRKLVFRGISKKDIYNITAPFNLGGKEYIAGRVESREDEDSETRFFFRNDEGEYELDEKAPVLKLQDPFITFHREELILGGVEVSEKGYRTVFYKGDSLYSLKKYAQGPIGMKDIRLLTLPDGKIGIFTRPQGPIGGRGRIGFFIIEFIEELPQLDDERYFSAKLLPGNFSDEEWLGSNFACILKDGRIGVLGHIAGYSENQEKNYYPITFCLDSSLCISDVKIIAKRQDLPEGEFKRQDLKNVIFGGGLIRHEDGTARLYTGVSDAEAYELLIKDPFVQ